MNKNYIEEYEEMSLCDFADELVEPLCTIKKDLTKTIYIHYAKERDKNDELQQENKKYKEVIEKIKTRYCDYYGTTKEINDDYVLRNVLKEISDILKEVE